MEARTREQIKAIASAIDHHIGILRGHGLQHAALMLDMARIDIESRINSISEDEFSELCRALERRQNGEIAAPRRCARAVARSSRNGLLDRRPQLSERRRLG
jgi:hypothetical protein